MHPILLKTESFTIYSYSVFFFLAWAVGIIVFYRELKRRGWKLDTLMFIFTGAAIGAFIGAYIFEFVFYGWEEMITKGHELDISGKTVIGGITGGFVGVELVKKKIGYQASTGDAFALAIPAGLIVGRMGCFLGGCCFGTPTTLPWGLSFPTDSVPFLTQVVQGLITPEAPTSLPVHPTQIYGILFNTSLLVFLFIWRDRIKVSGNLFRLYLWSYAVFRLLTDFLRGDSQAMSAEFPKPLHVFLLIVILYYGIKLYRQELKPLLVKPTES
ncbi:MAG: prolipoprotein diacylglyceryl transferase [FCB group bacterium]|nr:prolipoprotein diacylglyceryl transferase [FCB group bacterium]